MFSRRRWWSVVVVAAASVLSPASSPGVEFPGVAAANPDGAVFPGVIAAKPDGGVFPGVVAAKPDGAVPTPTERLIAAVSRKLDHLQADIEKSPLTGVARRRLEARLFDVRTDIAAFGDPRDPTERARVRALRERADRLVRLLHDRPV